MANNQMLMIGAVAVLGVGALFLLRRGRDLPISEPEPTNLTETPGQSIERIKTFYDKSLAEFAATVEQKTGVPCGAEPVSGSTPDSIYQSYKEKYLECVRAYYSGLLEKQFGVARTLFGTTASEIYDDYLRVRTSLLSTAAGEPTPRETFEQQSGLSVRHVSSQRAWGRPSAFVGGGFGPGQTAVQSVTTGGLGGSRG